MPSTNLLKLKEFILSSIKSFFLKNFPRYLSLAGLSFSLILISFNKTIFLNYPGFFSGKFNFFETQSILLGEIFLLLSGSLFLLSKILQKQIKVQGIKKLNIFFIIFLLSLTLQYQNIHFLSALIIYLSFKIANKNELKILSFSFLSLVVLQSLLAIYQILNQHSFGLYFLGEPRLLESTKGIAKLKINTKTILRAYGSFAHPNILAAYIIIAINYLNQNKTYKKIQTVLYLGLLSSFSLASSIAISLINIFKYFILKRKKIILSLVFSLIILTTILGIRLQNNNYDSFNDRYEEIQEVANPAKQNLKKQPWEITPIHNIYLYTYQNYGILILLLLLASLAYQYKINPSLSLLIGIIFFFDHYWLSLGQGIILLAIAFSLKESSKRETTQTSPDYLEENPKPA